jgi:hypothetical protein
MVDTDSCDVVSSVSVGLDLRPELFERKAPSRVRQSRAKAILTQLLGRFFTSRSPSHPRLRTTLIAIWRAAQKSARNDRQTPTHAAAAVRAATAAALG